MRHRTEGRSAFSLMELTTVIVIVGVLAMVARPKMQSYIERERVRALDRRIKLDLTMARSEAIKRRVPMVVTFDPNGAFYEIPGLKNVATVDGVQLTYRVDLKGANGFSAELLSVDFGGLTNVTFDTFGVPDAPGTIVIGSGKTRALMTVQKTVAPVNTTFHNATDPAVNIGGATTVSNLGTVF